MRGLVPRITYWSDMSLDDMASLGRSSQVFCAGLGLPPAGLRITYRLRRRCGTGPVPLITFPRRVGLDGMVPPSNVVPVEEFRVRLYHGPSPLFQPFGR